MFIRRTLLSGVIMSATLAIGSTAATADQYIGGWQKDYPLIKYGVIPVETQTQTTKSMDEFLKHAEKETGVKWKLYQASNYSGVMNALIANQIDLAWLSGKSYCQTYEDSNGGVEPVVAAQEPDGSMGYVSVLVVKADSPYKNIADLKGKTVARTDPLSGSGYIVPTLEFMKMGTPVDEYFNSPLSGGHPQGVLGVLRGTYDGAFTWTSRNDNIGNIRKMIDKGLLKRDQIRVVWTSNPLPSPPIVISKDLPLAMRVDIAKLFIRLKDKDMKLAEAIAQGKTNGLVRVYHENYELFCEAAKAASAAKKRKRKKK
ncbi:MAG: phosphonate ABC transporter substrate-binding protein [Gammaproteobacteria bacterium]|nr:MAG: phosphonate ABC transporter substrate-binding protein [Gammaproteobacteria bacterium]